MVVFEVYYGHSSSIVFISCPSLRTCSENLDLPSTYLKSFLCSLNLVLKFLIGSSYIKFVAVGACRFINPLPVIFVILFYFILFEIYQFDFKHRNKEIKKLVRRSIDGR